MNSLNLTPQEIHLFKKVIDKEKRNVKIPRETRSIIKENQHKNRVTPTEASKPIANKRAKTSTSNPILGPKQFYDSQKTNATNSPRANGYQNTNTRPVVENGYQSKQSRKVISSPKHAKSCGDILGTIANMSRKLNNLFR